MWYFCNLVLYLLLGFDFRFFELLSLLIAAAISLFESLIDFFTVSFTFPDSMRLSTDFNAIFCADFFNFFPNLLLAIFFTIVGEDLITDLVMGISVRKR